MRKVRLLITRYCLWLLHWHNQTRNPLTKSLTPKMLPPPSPPVKETLAHKMFGRGTGTVKQHDILIIVEQVEHAIWTQWSRSSCNLFVIDENKLALASGLDFFVGFFVRSECFEARNLQKQCQAFGWNVIPIGIDPSLPLTLHVQAWSLDCWCLSKPPAGHHSGGREVFWGLSSRGLLLVSWVAVLVSAATSHFPVSDCWRCNWVGLISTGCPPP